MYYIIIIMFNFLFYTNFAYARVIEAKILAIVDDQVISNFDLDRRVDLMKRFSVSEIVNKSVLQHLIDEKLFFKYGKDLNINVTDKEVSDIVANAGVSPDDSYYKEMENQIKAKLILSKMVDQYIVPTVSVLPTEVDSYINNDINVKDVVNLVKFITDENGGKKEIKIGWVNVKSLDINIRAVVENLGIGRLSSPVKIGSEYARFKVLDSENENIINARFKIRKVENKDKVDANNACIADIIDVKGQELEDSVRKRLFVLKKDRLGSIYDFVDADGEKYSIVFCGSTLYEDVYRKIFISKMGQEHNKYLAKLREHSFVEVRY